MPNFFVQNFCLIYLIIVSVSATVQARFIDGGEMDNFFGSKAEKFWSKKIVKLR
jgi:hypothetical protein